MVAGRFCASEMEEKRRMLHVRSHAICTLRRSCGLSLWQQYISVKPVLSGTHKGRETSQVPTVRETGLSLNSSDNESTTAVNN